MRRYHLTINGHEHTVEVDELTADTFQVTIEGHTVEVRLDDHADLAQANITPAIEPGRQIISAAPDTAVKVRPAPATSAPPPATRPAARPAAGGSAMTAPMPGVILSVEVSPGAQVKRGDVLMVLEAMKMKNSLQASRDGTVAEVLVSAGQQVKHGEALLRYQEG